jgi:hypothetical protein
MIAALLSLFLISSDAAATSNVTQAPSGEEAAATTTEASEAPKKICKRQPVTGQIQGTKRVCMTAEQWKAAQQSAERARR